MPAEQVFLHVGCGPARKQHTTTTFAGPDWRELRLDINPEVSPDIVGTMTDMAEVPTASVDAIYSSHNIEHLFAHEVPLALAEFIRVLRPDGFLVITCPDLQSIAALVAEDKLTEAACISPIGPIAPIDMIYGHRPQIAAGNLFMAHRCGFTRRVLENTLRAAGFIAMASATRYTPHYDIWVVAMKRPSSDTELRALAEAHIPP
jgi:SAM-dependent methyltransferase